MSRTARAVERKNRVRYVLIMPCWILLVVVTIGRLVEITPFGPIFSNHV